jgi:hypothetical protein
MVFGGAWWLVLLAADTHPEPSWTTLSSSGGYVLEQRAVKDSDFFEYRVSTDVELPVSTLCDGIFEWASMGRDHAMLLSRRLLEESADARVVYDQIQAPGPVAPRDFAFSMHRQRGRDGSCRIEVALCNDKAPPLAQGWVRLTRLRSHWDLEPRPRGAHVTYWLFSEPGGSIPPVLVHGSQRDAALDTVKRAIRLLMRDGTRGR